MHICIINPYYDAVAETTLEVTGRYRHVEAIASALSRRGHQVTVIQAFGGNKTEHRNGVQFCYALTPQRSPSQLSGGIMGTDLLFPPNLKSIIDTLEEVQPDAVHMNGITLLQPLAAIGRWCASKRRPLTVSHHGGSPSRLPWVRTAHRKALSQCRAAFFTTEQHAEEWISSGLLRRDQLRTCMEVSSTFAPADRVSARTKTNIHGNPVFVWNAGLHKRKDPLTALRGFSLIRKQWIEARLYMIYVSNEMEPELRKAIADDPCLRSGVEMRGFIPPPSVEDFLNSADFIVQSSLSEFSGYSILEAMACGVIPVVTDIPSFRAMTNSGRFGILFPRGDYESMARDVSKIDLAKIALFSQAVRAHFVQSLSYEALAKTYERSLTRPA